MSRTKQLIKYWWGRFRLAGAYILLPIALVVLIGGISIRNYGLKHMTTASVHVSGYYRSDGTYVRPYWRRPPGSVARDQPYEALANVGGLAILGGVILSGVFLYKLFLVSDYKLLPWIDVGVPVPITKRQLQLSATARKAWACERCKTLISSGAIYWYFETGYGRNTSRHRFCQSCRAILEREQARYNEALRTKQEQQYRRYFGAPRARS